MDFDTVSCHKMEYTKKKNIDSTVLVCLHRASYIKSANKRGLISYRKICQTNTQKVSPENVITKRGESWGLTSIRYVMPSRRVCNDNAKIIIVNVTMK